MSVSRRETLISAADSTNAGAQRHFISRLLYHERFAQRNADFRC
jgi:hypothetical protein